MVGASENNRCASTLACVAFYDWKPVFLGHRIERGFGALKGL